jgi:hypothetical protein
MAKRTQLKYGDEDYQLPEADATDANSAIERSGEQPWTPDITRDVLDKVQRVVTALPGIVSAQASAAGLMASFEAADRGAIVPPTPGQVAASGAGAGGGIGLVNGTGGGTGGMIGGIAGSIGAAQSIFSQVTGLLDKAVAPGSARAGDAFSVWQGMQQEHLSNQGSAGTLKSVARNAYTSGPMKYLTGAGWLIQAYQWAFGPSSHGSKPAQGN